MALVVLDASVVIAHADSQDALHDAATKALGDHADDDLVLPASAYAEVLVGLPPSRFSELRAALTALAIRIEPIDAGIAEAAARLRARRPSLRLPDALVVAVGDVLGADVVLTGDRRWRQLERVRVLP